MVRPLRIEFEGALYHLTSRGDRKEIIFEDDADRQRFLEILENVITQAGWICHAYCLMDNHYHLVIETPRANLANGMRQLNGIYTQAYNRRHDRTGHVFQGRYKSIIVDADRYFIELCRYVLLNPVRAGMVDGAEKWSWSSYRISAGLATFHDAFVNTSRLLAYFSSDTSTAQKKFISFTHDGISNESIWQDLGHQIFLGDDAFIEHIQQKKPDACLDYNLAKAQRLPPALPLSDIADMYDNRDQAIIAAYETGAYSYAKIAIFFHVHFSTVGRIIRANKKCNINRPDNPG